MLKDLVKIAKLKWGNELLEDRIKEQDLEILELKNQVYRLELRKEKEVSKLKHHKKDHTRNVYCHSVLLQEST